MTASVDVARARALGAPTRRTILQLLGEADGPVTVAVLTEQIGLNHNAIRRHLAQLVEAGLVVETKEARTTRGRPRLLYRLAPATDVADEASYERLAVLLATALASGEDPAEVGRRSVAADGAGADTSPDPVGALADRLAASGFEPHVHRRGERVDIVLGRCPFEAAALANPDAVCRLHRGLADGIAEVVGGLQVEGLVAKDPRRAGCRLTVSETS